MFNFLKNILFIVDPQKSRHSLILLLCDNLVSFQKRAFWGLPCGRRRLTGVCVALLALTERVAGAVDGFPGPVLAGRTAAKAASLTLY